MKSAGKARNNGLYRHIRTSKEIIRNLLNDSANSMQLKTPYFFLFFFFCTLYPNLPRYLPSAKYSPWEYIIRFASLI